ncbi:MAG: PA14 domain-containing protein, partial [Eubacteriales bacterium]|nr:PA14 domain-containing protein [Eubacteriales bacterium]
MKKKRFASIGIILSLLLTAATPVSAVPAGNPDPEDMAIYLNSDFNASAGYIEGNSYTANGDVALGQSIQSTGLFYHKAGTSYTYPKWYDDSYPGYELKNVELSQTEYDAAFPSLVATPAIGNYVNSAKNNQPLVIDQNIHYGTLNITHKKNVTFDTGNGDIHVVIDTLNITADSASPLMYITGENKLFLYISDFTGTKFIIQNTSGNPDQVYIVAHDYLPLHATVPFYGHVIYTGIANIVSPSNFSIIGSLVTDASTVSLPYNDAITGLLYAPDAAVSLGGSSNITGRLVADSLNMTGSPRIIYDSLYATLDLPAELIEAPPEIYTVNATVSPIGAGTVTPTYAEVSEGETIHLTVAPADGFVFTGFTSSDPSMVPDAGGNVIVTGNVTVTAHFEILGLDPNYTNGLLGEYYDESNLQNESALRMRRIDPRIAFNFGYEPPDAVIEPEDYSIRWTGYIRPTVSGNYSFTTYSDDGVRVTVNDTMVIDNWGLLSLA